METHSGLRGEAQGQGVFSGAKKAWVYLEGMGCRRGRSGLTGLMPHPPPGHGEEPRVECWEEVRHGVFVHKFRLFQVATLGSWSLCERLRPNANKEGD